MKFLTIFILFLTSLLAKEYYSKVEPIDIYTISSKVNSEILKADENLIGKQLSKKPFIVMDDKLDINDLNSTKQKIASIKEMIKADKEIALNLEESLKRKIQNYERIKDLSIKSKTQKDAIYFDVINTKNQLLNTQKEIQNFKSQLADLNYKKIVLQKSISDKHISYNGFVLYELLVKKGQVVNIGTPLAKVANINKAILTLYVDREDLKNIKNKTVYINGKKTSYKVSRVSYIADSINISKYKVQIIINPPKIFSNLVKVELK